MPFFTCNEVVVSGKCYLTIGLIMGQSISILKNGEGKEYGKKYTKSYDRNWYHFSQKLRLIRHQPSSPIQLSRRSLPHRSPQGLVKAFAVGFSGLYSSAILVWLLILPIIAQWGSLLECKRVGGIELPLLLKAIATLRAVALAKSTL